MKFSTQALLLATSVTMTMVAGGTIGSYGMRRLESLGADTLEKCTPEEYTLYLAAIEKHFVMLAEPAAQQQDCPSLAFHAVRTKENDLVKLAHEYTDDEDLDKLELGSFALERIVQAHTVAPAGSFLDKYNFFHNNCGSFLINMGEELEINPNTPSIVGFVRDQLTTKTLLPEVMKALYREEEGVELIESHHIPTAASKSKALYREEEGVEFAEPEEEKAPVASKPKARYQEEDALKIVGAEEEKVTVASKPKALYRQEEGMEIAEPEGDKAASTPKALYREEEGIEIVTPEEEKAIVGEFVATYIEEHCHYTSTTAMEENMMLFGEESGAMAPAASVVVAALATAAGALAMMV